jgi:hypothetical protein
VAANSSRFAVPPSILVADILGTPLANRTEPEIAQVPATRRGWSLFDDD